ncbi:type II secretion system F family protein [Isoptericola jiangsuensis]|uniref:type II secretion system F family protein n=1 Tax=Isoptericola jiangsuensis TaxID=548579 RepID=UPI003AAC0251
MSAALVVGACVAGAVWSVTVPAGRRAAALSVTRPAAAGRMRRLLRTAAQDDAGRVRVVLAQVVALLRSGAPPSVAWSRALGVRSGPDGVPDAVELAPVVGGPGPAAAVVAAARLAGEVGAPLGRVLESVADALVAEAEAQADREASLAGPRTTARLLLWLPLLGTVLGAALGADPVASATDGGVGTAAVCAGVVALGAGRWWTGRLVASARAAGGAP